MPLQCRCSCSAVALCAVWLLQRVMRPHRQRCAGACGWRSSARLGGALVAALFVVSVAGAYSLPVFNQDVAADGGGLKLRVAEDVPQAVTAWLGQHGGSVVDCVTAEFEQGLSRSDRHAPTWRTPLLWVVATPSDMAAVLLELGWDKELADKAKNAGAAVAGTSPDNYHNIVLTYYEWPSGTPRENPSSVAGLVEYGQYLDLVSLAHEVTHVRQMEVASPLPWPRHWFWEGHATWMSHACPAAVLETRVGSDFGWGVRLEQALWPLTDGKRIDFAATDTTREWTLALDNPAVVSLNYAQAALFARYVTQLFAHGETPAIVEVLAGCGGPGIEGPGGSISTHDFDASFAKVFGASLQEGQGAFEEALDEYAAGVDPQDDTVLSATFQVVEEGVADDTNLFVSSIAPPTTFVGWASAPSKSAPEPLVGVHEFDIAQRDVIEPGNGTVALYPIEGITGEWSIARVNIGVHRPPQHPTEGDVTVVAVQVFQGRILAHGPILLDANGHLRGLFTNAVGGFDDIEVADFGNPVRTRVIISDTLCTASGYPIPSGTATALGPRVFTDCRCRVDGPDSAAACGGTGEGSGSGGGDRDGSASQISHGRDTNGDGDGEQGDDGKGDAQVAASNGRLGFSTASLALLMCFTVPMVAKAGSGDGSEGSMSTILTIGALVLAGLGLQCLVSRGGTSGKLRVRQDLHLRRKLQHALTAVFFVVVEPNLVGLQAFAALATGAACILGVHQLRLRHRGVNHLYMKALGPIMRSHEATALPGAFWFVVGTAIAVLVFPRPIAARKYHCATLSHVT